jgi:hypothetical protein
MKSLLRFYPFDAKDFDSNAADLSLQKGLSTKTQQLQLHFPGRLEELGWLPHETSSAHVSVIGSDTASGLSTENVYISLKA